MNESMNTELRIHFPILLAVLFLVLLGGLLVSYAFLDDVSVVAFIDIPSAIFLLTTVLALTWTQFSLSEMRNAVFDLFNRRKSDYDRFQQDYFWQCVIRNLLVFGALGNSIGLVQMLQNLNTLDSIDEYLFVCMLTFLYCIVFCLFLPIPALYFNRRSSSHRIPTLGKTKKRSSIMYFAGYFMVFTSVYLPLTSFFNLSFLIFIDVPSLLIICGTCSWVYVLALGEDKSALSIAFLIYVGFAYYFLDFQDIFSYSYFLTLASLLGLWIFLAAGFKSKTGLFRNIVMGELLTISLSLSAIVGGFIGTTLMVKNFGDPSSIGPNVAIAILSCLYALLGFIFLSFPLEDSEHLQKRQLQDINISRICWFFFPIINQFIVLGVILILIAALSNWESNILSLLESIPPGIITSIKMVSVWLVSFLFFIIIYTVFQYILLLKTYNQIQQTQEQLIRSEKLAAIGQLVAGVAHEINNPINFIKSNIQPLKDYLLGYRRYVNHVREHLSSLQPPLQEKLSVIAEEADLDYADLDSEKLMNSLEDGSQRIARIVADLRQYSRVDKDYYSPVDLNDLIDSTLNLLFSRYKKHVTVHKEYGSLPPVLCSPGQMGQVLMNLLSNAEQAIEGEGNVWIRTGMENGRVQVEIKDDGKGIAPEILTKIFDPFFTTKPVGSGTGLGLSISLGIVQQHGGEIVAASQPGQGATFTVILPMRSESELKNGSR